MKLLATNCLQLTEDKEINIGLILNGVWQIADDEVPVNTKQDIQNIFAAKYITWNLADSYGPAEGGIGKFQRQLIVQYGKYTFAYLQVLIKWILRLTKITKKLVEQNIGIFLKKVNVDSLSLLTCHGQEYGDNRCCLPQIVRFISGNWRLW